MKPRVLSARKATWQCRERVEVEDETHFSLDCPIRAAFLQNEYRIPCSAILMNCTLRPGDDERSKSSLWVSALYKNIHKKSFV